MIQRIRYGLTGLFGIAVLAAFLYGSAGCVVVQPRPDDPCPKGRTEARLESTFKLYHCKGTACEMLMTTCVVSPNEEALHRP